MSDEKLAHRAGGEREEVHPFCGSRGLVGELDPRFVNERRRPQRVVCALALERRDGELTQLVVHERKKPLSSRRIACTRLPQELRQGLRFLIDRSMTIPLCRHPTGAVVTRAELNRANPDARGGASSFGGSRRNSASRSARSVAHPELPSASTTRTAE